METHTLSHRTLLVCVNLCRGAFDVLKAKGEEGQSQQGTQKRTRLSAAAAGKNREDAREQTCHKAARSHGLAISILQLEESVVVVVVCRKTASGKAITHNGGPCVTLRGATIVHLFPGHTGCKRMGNAPKGYWRNASASIRSPPSSCPSLWTSSAVRLHVVALQRKASTAGAK